MKEKRIQSRNWCFTLNNPTKPLQLEMDKVNYYIYGEEIAPTTGTPHFQGYIQFKRSQDKNFVRKFIEGAHVKKADGTYEQNYIYCTKEKKFHEFGIPVKTKGQRTDLQKACKIIKEQGLSKMIEEYPETFVKYTNGLRELANEYEPDYDHETVRGIWIYGPTGSGKSTKSRTEYGTYYVKNPYNEWWDLYKGEETVILEDVDEDRNNIAYNIKIWADKWHFQSQVKGGHVKLKYKNLIVTSNFTIEELFVKQPTRTIDAIRRRFQEIHLQ